MGTYFLSSLYSCEAQLSYDSCFDRVWFRNVVKLWLEQFANDVDLIPDGIAHKGEEKDKGRYEDEFANLVYGRAAMELVVGVTGGLLMLKYGTDEKFRKLTTNLFRIFEHTQTNFDFAWQALHEYVKQLRLV